MACRVSLRGAVDACNGNGLVMRADKYVALNEVRQGTRGTQVRGMIIGVVYDNSTVKVHIQRAIVDWVLYIFDSGKITTHPSDARRR